MTLDLVAVVPDKDIEQSLLGLFEAKRESLHLKTLRQWRILVHPGRDPGVFHSGFQLLAPFSGDSRFALLLLDREWEGAPPSTCDEIESKIEEQCKRTWGDRARCVCIAPEIEAWIWSDSPHVHEALGWQRREELQKWLAAQNLWPPDTPKPLDPKKAFELAVREKRIPPSAAIFGTLARKVSICRCTDRSFLRLTETLRQWFQ